MDQGSQLRGCRLLVVQPEVGSWLVARIQTQNPKPGAKQSTYIISFKQSLPLSKVGEIS